MRFAKIEIHLSIILLLAIAAYSGFLLEAFLFLGVFFSHEIGHLIWIKIFSGEVKLIHLTEIGGIIELQEEKRPFIQHFLIDSGGILINLLLLNILPLFLKDNMRLEMISQYNKLMLFFNLLPVYPLDGFRILSHFLGLFYEEEYLYEVLFYLSLLLLVVMTIGAYIGRSLGLAIVLAFLVNKTFELKRKSKQASILHYGLLYRYSKYNGNVAY